MNTTAYFTFDFTLDEIRQLRVRQRWDGGVRSERYDWLFGIPSFEDIANLMYNWKQAAKQDLGMHAAATRGGMWAELKKPRWIKQQTGMSMEDLFVQELERLPIHIRNMFFPPSHCPVDDDSKPALVSPNTFVLPPPLVVHCFESRPLKRIKTKFQRSQKAGLLGSSVHSVLPPLVLLLSQRKCHTIHDWDSLKSYLDGVNVDKACMWNNGAATKGMLIAAKAHERDMGVYTWTQRAEKKFLEDPFLDAQSEISALFCSAHVDGILAENVDIAVRAATIGCGNPVLSLQHGRIAHGVFPKFSINGSQLSTIKLVLSLLAAILLLGKWRVRKAQKSRDYIAPTLGVTESHSLKMDHNNTMINPDHKYGSLDLTAQPN